MGDNVCLFASFLAWFFSLAFDVVICIFPDISIRPKEPKQLLFDVTNQTFSLHVHVHYFEST